MCQLGRKIIADNVKKYREIIDMTREDLSLSIGYDNSYISKLENYKINIPIDTVEDIARVLNVDVGKLLN